MLLYTGTVSIHCLYTVQARSQPARWGGGGGPNLDGWNTRRTPPPLGHCPRDVINLKNAPTLGHSQAHPPLGIARVTSSIWKTPPLLDIHKHPPIFQGWNKIAKGWNKIAERWNKIAKGWNKIAKGWNKIFGMGNWGGSYDPPDPPPPGYGPAVYTVSNTSVYVQCL